jgi:predicted dehydrogenase
MSRKGMNRRRFLTQSTAGSVGIAAASLTASSYCRISGANDRIAVGIVGCSNRGREALMPALLQLENELNVQLTAVCDIWKVNLERGGNVVKERTGRTARAFNSLDDLLGQKDIDAVINATGDFQHAPLLTRIVNAGKDCYCEKPMATSVEDAKEAAQAVKRTGRVVQIGTQGLSSPALWKLKAFAESGKLGKISKVEHAQSYWGPRWRGRSEPDLLRESDTDWKQWLAKKPWRPFDPRLYFEYRVYKDFSTGIAGQWMSHQVAAVAVVMGEAFPASASAEGGVFVWDDGRETPDTIAANLVYPSGWMYSYSCSFGTDYLGHERYYGLNGTVEADGEDYVVSGVGGGAEDTPVNRKRQERSAATGAGFRVNPNRLKEKLRITSPIKTQSLSLHMKNWIDCIRSRAKPNADVMTGYCHSVACIMAHQSVYAGKRLYWDGKSESIVESPPQA